MLSENDAAILIGDPALLALEDRATIEEQVGPCTWHDLAHEWHTRTSLPWVAAVWAIRPEALTASHITPQQLTEDLNHSRDNGQASIDSLVNEWAPRIALPAATIHQYLTHNIHYTLRPRLHSRDTALPPICRGNRHPPLSQPCGSSKSAAISLLPATYSL